MSRAPWKEGENAIQEQCRALYRAAGCTVYWLSQYRRSNQTPGLPDLWVMAPHIGTAWWHEVKTGRGKRTAPQLRFAEECHASGIGYTVGGIDDAREQLVAVGLAVGRPTFMLRQRASLARTAEISYDASPLDVSIPDSMKDDGA